MSCPLNIEIVKFDYISMKSFRLLALLFILGWVSAAYTNTTDFWTKQLGYAPKDMHFQCYAGNSTHS